MDGNCSNRVNRIVHHVCAYFLIISKETTATAYNLSGSIRPNLVTHDIGYSKLIVRSQTGVKEYENKPLPSRSKIVPTKLS